MLYISKYKRDKKYTNMKGQINYSINTDSAMYFSPILTNHSRKTTTLTAFREKHSCICYCAPRSFKWNGPIVYSAAKELIWDISPNKFMSDT